MKMRGTNLFWIAILKIILQEAHESIQNLEALRTLKDTFWDKVQSYPLIMQIVEGFMKTSNKTLEGYQAIEFFLNENKNDQERSFLLALISGPPELNELHKKISALGKKVYNWSEVYTNEEIINEYAALIEKDASHIEPHEVNIMAYLFNKQVKFYTGNAEQPLTFNPASLEVIGIYYTGQNHFERVQDSLALVHPAQQSVFFNQAEGRSLRTQQSNATFYNFI